jgi:hypothetical protein
MHSVLLCVIAALHHVHGVEPRGVASSPFLLQETQPAEAGLGPSDAPEDQGAAHTSLVSCESNSSTEGPPVYVHDPDIPSWCYNRNIVDRIIRRGLLTPKECRGLVRADADDEAEFAAKRRGVDLVNEGRRERARNPSQESGRASVWILLGVLGFFVVVGVSLSIPYCYKPTMPVDEYYPPDGVGQAYAQQDVGYGQQAARAQEHAGYTDPRAQQEYVARMAAPAGPAHWAGVDPRAQQAVH